MTQSTELLPIVQEARAALQSMMDAWLDYHDAHSLTDPVTGAAGNAFDKALAARDLIDAALTTTPEPTDPAGVSGVADAERVARLWGELVTAANNEPSDDEEAAFAIGRRDGFQEAVQIIDELTGGDGEYRYCTDHDSERHCPDPVFMVRNILARCAALRPSPVLEVAKEALERIRRLEPETLWDAPARHTGERPRVEALDATEVREIVDAALQAIKEGEAR